MNGDVVVPSAFWQSLFQVGQFVSVLGPLLLWISGVVWLIRSRSRPAFVGCLGTTLILAGVIFHHLGSSITMVGAPYPQPTAVADSAKFFLALYAVDFGTLLAGIGLLWHFLRKP